MNDAERRTALVTGSAHNLGHSIALELAREGATVVAHARTVADAEAAAASISAAGSGHVIPMAFDLASADEVEDGFATLDAMGLTVDSLVLNAAHLGLHDGDPLQQDPAFFDEVLTVNVSASYRCSMAVAHRLVDAGRSGSFVFISSLAGARAIHGRAAYNTSKAAIDGLVRSLAIDLAPHDIRVNGIAPGYIWSDRWEHISPTEAEARRALIPIGSETTREEIARLASFLLSDACPTVTGERIVIDGGLAAQQSPLGAERVERPVA